MDRKHKRTEVVDTTEFARRVKLLMQQKRLTPSQLADRADIARSAVTQFFSGARKPSADAVFKLATVLDASTDYLLGKRESIEVADLLQHAKVTDLLNLFMELSSVDQDRIIEMTRLLAKATSSDQSPERP